MKNTLLFLTSMLCVQIGISQGDVVNPPPDFSMGPPETLQDHRLLDSLALWEEKAYLHLDRRQAEAGEAVFFKAYVFNTPTGRRLSPSGVLKVELRDSENALVATQYHPLQNGAGQGVVRLPKKLADGTYQLLAYTRWMENYGEGQFYSTTLEVGEVPESSRETGVETSGQITFHPEGGCLLAGVPNRLVIQISRPDSEGLKGQIVDESGAEVGRVQEYGSGFRLAIFTPQAGRQYEFHTEMGEVTPLPEIASRGYSLKVNNLEADKLSLEVQPTDAMSKGAVVLKGERDGKTYFIHMLEFGEAPVATLEVPKAGLPAGLMEFSLTGLDETVWTRRPVWIDRSGALHIEVEPLSTEFGKGKEAAFRIRVSDPDGNPVQTDLSVGITDGNDLHSEALPDYLNPLAPEKASLEDRQTRFLQDLKAQALASRHAGRALPLEIRYPVQRSLELHGTAYDLDNNLLANTEIQMLASSDDNLVIRELKTDTAGILHLDSLQVFGETQFVFRTKGAEQEQRLVKVIPVRDVPKEREEKEEEVQSKIYRRAVKRKNLVEATPTVPFDTTGVIQLDEATVAKRREQQKVVPTLYGLQPLKNDVAVQDMEKPISIHSLAQRIPGIQVRFDVYGFPSVSHMRRGGGNILWVVDGQVIYTNDPYLSPLTFLTPGDILRMEFYIEVAQTAMFGVITAPNTGIMVVYTRSGSLLDYTNRKAGGLLFKGYEPNLDYEAWLAERRQDRKLRKKVPQTLYWDPVVQTDENGEAVIRFESPADYTRVQLRVETLTPGGLVGSFREEF